MASTDRPNGQSTTTTTAVPEPTEFEMRRSELVAEIGDSLETVLQQMNALNRSLEGIIAIGNDFSSVEALWSQFETVMGGGQDDGTRENNEEEGGEGEEEGQVEEGPGGEGHGT